MTPADARASVAPARDGLVTPDAVLRAIGIKGFAQPQGVADVVLATPDEVRPVLDALVADGFVAPSAGALRLTESGSSRVGALLAEEQAAWGPDSAEAALDAFVTLDQRMKEIVTAWQLRDPDAQLINDHSDPDYDRSVLDRLAVLHADAVAVADSSRGRESAAAGYRMRLVRAAMDAARAGDGRYVASPRVDSYHGVWFELHEELIQPRRSDPRR